MPGYQGGVVSDFGLSRIKIMGIQKSIEEKISSKTHREIKVLTLLRQVDARAVPQQQVRNTLRKHKLAIRQVSFI